MHQTSALYKQLLRLPHYTEHKIVINGVGYAEGEYYSIDLSGAVIPGSTLQVGACPYRTIKATIVDLGLTIPTMAKLEPMSRITDGVRVSEWIPKGVYYIDTRDPNAPPGQLSFVGYDDMLKADTPYPGSSLSWPATDIDVVREIARHMGVTVDPRTVALMTNQYPVPFPAQYTMREVLGYRRASHVMNGWTFTTQDIITFAALVAAVVAILRYYNKAYDLVKKQKEQDAQIAATKEELQLLTYGVLACLKGLSEQGCDGAVTDAISKIEKHLNAKAHA